MMAQMLAVGLDKVSQSGGGYIGVEVGGALEIFFVELAQYAGELLAV